MIFYQRLFRKDGIPSIWSEEIRKRCEIKVKELLFKEAIIEISEEDVVFLSKMFVIPKSSGGFRPVFNLHELNSFVDTHHFKMESISILKDILQERDFIVKLGLKDAYLTVPIHKDHQCFLQFRWENRFFQFVALPFGLSSAPWIFTKILKPVVVFLRRRGIRLIIYLDDILILNNSFSALEKERDTVIQILELAGFLINWEKSVCIPTQKIEYLGLMINSVNQSLSLKKEKVKEILKCVTEMLRTSVISFKSIANLLGNFYGQLIAFHLRKLIIELYN